MDRSSSRSTGWVDGFRRVGRSGSQDANYVFDVTSRPTRGVVAAGDPQTVSAGAELLRQGGNAVDAAIAAAFAAFVCEMPLCSPLGGGVMVLERSGEAPRALELFARAPGLGATRPAALDFVDIRVNFGAATDVFHVGRGSAALPLALPGLFEAHRRWGSRPLAAVLEPAIDLARSGYVLGPGVAFVFRILTPIAARSRECHALYAHEGDVAPAGARLFNRDLASTLEALAREPGCMTDLYDGLAAEFGPSAGGLITTRDFAEARVIDCAPIRVVHGDWELFTMPGPSTGGALVALGLRLLDGVGRFPFLSKDHVVRIAQVQEILLAERHDAFDEECRDPEAVRALLDETRIRKLRARIGRAGASGSGVLGSTTHISVIDEHGGAVALTLTNGEGSGHVLGSTGMVVNNLLGEQDIHPHGFHRDPPGRALCTMMAPTLLRRGADRIALGSGGSNRLRNAILQVLVGLVEHRVDPERAVYAPRIQLEPGPEQPRLAFEAAGLDPAIVSSLRASYPDHRIFEERNLYFGGTHVALRVGDTFGGAGDPRRSGAIALL
jgi:gamma-glutamyltranspeptidase/glutathione hydrolase